MSRRTATALALISLGLVGLAGCGGSGGSDSTTTSAGVTTAPATVPPPVATAPLPTPSVPATAPTAPFGAESLPPENAVPGVGPGEARTIATAKELVDVLYQAGDPTKPAAQARLEDEGYAGGILRDQAGTDPTTGLALLRSYAIRLRDEAAARDEVSAAIDEVRRSSAGGSSDVEVSGIPDAEALRVQVTQGGLSGTVVFVTFPAGGAVYGIQGVSANGPDVPQDQIIGAARALAKRVGATP